MVCPHCTSMYTKKDGKGKSKDKICPFKCNVTNSQMEALLSLASSSQGGPASSSSQGGGPASSSQGGTEAVVVEVPDMQPEETQLDMAIVALIE